MGLYLCSKSDSPDLNRAFTYWNSLQSIPITTESEKHQRELDLEHILAACLHSSEWSRCSSLLHSSFCSPRHVYLYLRSLASSSEFKRIVSGYLDYRSTLFSDSPTSFVQEKQFVVALLLDIAKITNPECQFVYRKVHCQQMTHGRCVYRISETYVVVIIP